MSNYFQGTRELLIRSVGNKRRHIFVSDVVQGTEVYKVRANLYPANVTVEMDLLEHPIGAATVFKNILCCAESKRNAIALSLWTN